MLDNHAGRTCPYDQAVIKPGQDVVVCPQCGVAHHQECWEANGGCTSVGCVRAMQANGQGVATTAAVGALIGTRSPTTGKRSTKALAVAGLLIAFLGLAASAAGFAFIVAGKGAVSNRDSRLIALAFGVPGGLFSVMALVFSIAAFKAAGKLPTEPGAKAAVWGMVFAGLGICLTATTALFYFRVVNLS